MEQLSVVLVGEESVSLVRFEPAERVDLPVRDERRRRVALGGFHEPVADHLVAASTVLVAGLADGGPESTAQTGLLLHLAEGGVLVSFVSVGLSFREAPVVVAGPVHERDLVPGVEPLSDPGPSRERSNDDATRGAHGGYWLARPAQDIAMDEVVQARSVNDSTATESPPRGSSTPMPHGPPPGSRPAQ